MSISIEGTLSKVREIGHFRESLVTLLIWIAILDITWQCETYKYFCIDLILRLELNPSVYFCAPLSISTKDHNSLVRTVRTDSHQTGISNLWGHLSIQKCIVVVLR
jgi:hypothetical protein